jgi:hypothetical protein
MLLKYIPIDVEERKQEIGWLEICDTNIFYLIKAVLLKTDSSSVFTYKKVENVNTFE